MEIAFQSLSEFLLMGKHGFYVWLCYGLTAMFIFGNIFLYRARQKRVEREIKTSLVRLQKQKENHVN